MPVKARRAKPRWLEVVALAACLVAGVAVGTQWQNGSVISSNGSLTASGYLAGALETQLASASGDTHMLVSFRSKAGGYCRVFAGEAFDGIACKNAGSWELIRTQSSSARTGAAYRQAGSESPALMSAAQDLMTGDPLSVADEQKARASHWKSECQTPGDAPTYC
jgi:hypothetical protein